MLLNIMQHRSMLRFAAALATIFTLYSIRAWFVLGGAFFGLMFVRVAYTLAFVDDEKATALLMLLPGLFLLRVSYSWFAVRWHGEPAADGEASARTGTLGSDDPE